MQIRKPKWTSDGIWAKINQGWKQDGIAQFDTYYSMVATSCADEDLVDVDMHYLAQKKAAMTKQEERKRKRDNTRETRENGWVVASFNAWSDDDKDDTKPVEDDDTENYSSSDNDGEDEISNPVTNR